MVQGVLTVFAHISKEWLTVPYRTRVKCLAITPTICNVLSLENWLLLNSFLISQKLPDWRAIIAFKKGGLKDLNSSLLDDCRLFHKHLEWL